MEALIYDNAPQEVKSILDSFDYDAPNGYEECKRINKELNAIGWAIEYDLAAEITELFETYEPKNTKNVNGFLFKIIDLETAKEMFLDKETVFVLYEDNTEGQVIFEEEFNDENLTFGVEIGHLKTLREDFKEGEQNRFRNNNNISFEQWLENKIENL